MDAGVEIFELQQAYEGYVFYLNQVKKCDIETEKILIEFKKKSGHNYKDDNKIKPIRHNKPDIANLHDLLLGIHGANPTVLPGLNVTRVGATAA